MLAFSLSIFICSIKIRKSNLPQTTDDLLHSLGHHTDVQLHRDHRYLGELIIHLVHTEQHAPKNWEWPRNVEGWLVPHRQHKQRRVRPHGTEFQVVFVDCNGIRTNLFKLHVQGIIRNWRFVASRTHITGNH